jgi:DNA processing protein
MKNLNELKSLIVLNNIPSLGPVRIKRLIDFFGSATNVLSATEEELSYVENIGPSIAKNIVMLKNKIDVQKEIDALNKEGIKLICYNDENYPLMLKYLSDQPMLLYVKGELKSEDMISVSIVGTRKPTSYGRLVVEHIVKQLARYNLTIVSGLAYGIDTLAHEFAIKNGLRTIAVLGNGLSVYYPIANKKLQDKIPLYGAVISEFPYFYKPNKNSFPQRNRIIAALSLGTIVIEADIQSGAMITAKFAAELGKDVFAVPGSIFSKQSKGTNFLIKTGAKLVSSAEDVIEEIQKLSEILKHQTVINKTFVNQNEDEEKLDEETKKVLDIIVSEPNGLHIDKIQSISSLEITKLMNILFNLVMNGKIKELTGKIYVPVNNN